MVPQEQGPYFLSVDQLALRSILLPESLNQLCKALAIRAPRLTLAQLLTELKNSEILNPVYKVLQDLTSFGSTLFLQFLLYVKLKSMHFAYAGPSASTLFHPPHPTFANILKSYCKGYSLSQCLG